MTFLDRSLMREYAPVMQHPPPGPPYGYGPPPPPPQGYGYGYASQPTTGAMAWTCPYCRYVGPPQTEKKTSTGGWILFVALIFLCVPICWLALFLKETRRKCPSCGTSAGAT